MSCILPDMGRFAQSVVGMQLATPDECRHLEYSAPKTDAAIKAWGSMRRRLTTGEITQEEYEVLLKSK